MSLEARIKKIKETNSNAIIEKAKAEERLKHLHEQKEALEKEAAAMNVDPMKLNKEIETEVKEIESLTKKAEEILGIATDESTDEPF